MTLEERVAVLERQVGEVRAKLAQRRKERFCVTPAGEIVPDAPTGGAPERP